MKTVLVCVTVQRECERLILAGKRLADSAGMPLRVLHVMQHKDTFLGNPDAQEAMNDLYALSRSAGAEMTVVCSGGVRAAIVDYARQTDACCVVVGNDREGAWGMAEALEELLEDDGIMIMRA